MQGDLSIFDILLSSGIVVQSVLLLLIFCSVLSIAIVWKKYNEFKEIRKNNSAFLDVFRSEASLREVFDKSSTLENSPLKQVFTQGYEEIIKLEDSSSGKKSKDTLDNHIFRFGFQLFERAMERGVSDASDAMEKHLTTLASIGSISPFIGLFGTVWGIINSFTGIAQGGSTLDAVAPGIAEALVATAVGLFAAIPAVWFYNYFSNKQSLIYGQMKSFEKEFLNEVERSLV